MRVANLNESPKRESIAWICEPIDIGTDKFSGEKVRFLADYYRVRFWLEGHDVQSFA
jgi:hypothetical protein